ncbi:hypothetical protein DPEC_G00180810 [Dallia pectoralis]|uniref:Uncharacterized protein n=1 Tax=Dallia pectoralis TaxID=75939 RepID=A0ACC2GA33_DALPE|nr:hypothetical protein DPEC_G00180810 [Dallia pectoralis]
MGGNGRGSCRRHTLTDSSAYVSTATDVVTSLTGVWRRIYPHIEKYKCIVSLVPGGSEYSLLSTASLAITVSFLILFTIVGNVLVVIAVLTSHALKPPQNLFLVSLASADILVATLVMPFSLANELMDYWFFGKVWCDIYLALDVLFCTSSIVHLCAISLDRVAVFLVLLTVVLLAGILCWLLYQGYHMTDCNILTKERDQLETRYNNLTEERDQLQTRYVNLIKDRDELLNETERLKQSLALKDCPSGWMRLGSQCYYSSDLKKTWEQSRQDCVERGGHLVTIKSPEEQKFVNWMCGIKNYIWIGLTDSTTEGNWNWVDGTPLTTEYWDSGEPDGGVTENCGYFYSQSWNTGAWWDSSCSDTYRWICQKQGLDLQGATSAKQLA